jgi:hypothetical protein
MTERSGSGGTKLLVIPGLFWILVVFQLEQLWAIWDQSVVSPIETGKRYRVEYYTSPCNSLTTEQPKFRFSPYACRDYKSGLWGLESME